MKNQLLFFLSLSLLIGCAKKSEPIIITADDFHHSVDKVGEIMVHDIFSPPVASRVFAYPSIAAYEIIARDNDTYRSLENQLTGLTAIPEPPSDQPINFQLAALIAHMDLNKRLIFSEEIAKFIVKIKNKLREVE
jgi:hypothetical protein